MRVFITGGTGLIGSAVVAELLAHDHSVLGLARSDRSATALENAGASVVRGGLDDLDVLRRGAEESDGVVHLAFGNDFSSPEAIAAGIAQEARALDTLAGTLASSDRPLVMASATPATAGRSSTEADPLPTEGLTAGRNRTVQTLLDRAADGLRSSAVRLPRTVHDHGEGGFTGFLTHVARGSGIAGYPGDGSARWPAVHAADAATLFRLALEQAEPGTSWHAVDDEGVAVHDMMEVVGRRLGLPVEQVPTENFGALGAVFVTDQPSSSAHTRSALGWQPTHPGLLEDLENLEP